MIYLLITIYLIISMTVFCAIGSDDINKKLEYKTKKDLILAIIWSFVWPLTLVCCVICAILILPYFMAVDFIKTVRKWRRCLIKTEVPWRTE